MSRCFVAKSEKENSALSLKGKIVPFFTEFSIVGALDAITFVYNQPKIIKQSLFQTLL
jgi:hypothetical protein